MLEDRDYMREPDYGQSGWRGQFRLRWTWTTTLIATYVVILAAQQIAQACFDIPHTEHQPVALFVVNYLALSKEGLASGYIWQLFSYQFLHAGWLHLLFNSWAIFLFGSELERLLGARRYLTLFFSSGVVGGVFQMLTAFIPVFDAPVVGASAAAFGLVAAYAMMFPEQEIFMFFVPVPLRAKTALLIFVAIAVVSMFFPKDHVANAAHLGGMAVGWLYASKILNRALLGVDAQESYFHPQPAKTAEPAPDEPGDGDVDAVLDKISARGINSLSARERAILEAARKRMAQR